MGFQLGTHLNLVLGLDFFRCRHGGLLLTMMGRGANEGLCRVMEGDPVGEKYCSKAASSRGVSNFKRFLFVASRKFFRSCPFFYLELTTKTTMPVTGEYTWSETDSHVEVAIPLKGVSSKKVDGKSFCTDLN